MNDIFTKFNPGAFVDNLSYMGVGMACIFIVIGAIILSVVVLDLATRAVANRKKAKEENVEQQ
ncbi:MAG: hypothetical protein E7638_00440 [Ruminococcaceae bacterium]|nr:hypothetical protein [Oscillospiraceae bacterium]